MTEHAVLALAGIGLLAILCQWFAWWVKLPAILFLLVGGVVAGPVTGLLDPDALFGDLLAPFISLAVAIILFEGSLTLRLRDIRGLEKVVRRLITTALLITLTINALASYGLLDFPWQLALLFGAITTVTGPTVIVPMLRTVRPLPHIAQILRWEGITIDPIGALLAVLVFEFILAGQGGAALGHSLGQFAIAIASGGTIGIAFGYGLSLLLRHYLIPRYLHNMAALTLVFTAFALSNYVAGESGLLAVTAMGIWLANMRGIEIEEILNFKESLSVLLISGLFILLAARLDLNAMGAIAWPALGVLAAVQFIARPLKVLYAARGTALGWREKALLSWIAPRGIVAAAVSALFALRLEQEGIAQAGQLVSLTFFIIIGTVVLQSATARPLARWLEVAEPEPSGFLIVGASPLARTAGKALHDLGYAVTLVDTRWDYLRAAHMHGLTTYRGDVNSEHAEHHLDLIGLGNLLALSPRDEVNALAAQRYTIDFDSDHVFVLPAEIGDEAERDRATELFGRQIFGEGSSYRVLSEMLAQGARVHTTRLSENFDFDDYYRKHFRRSKPLFAIDPHARLYPYTLIDPPHPKPGWRIVALVLDPEETEATLQLVVPKGNSGAEPEPTNE